MWVFHTWNGGGARQDTLRTITKYDLAWEMVTVLLKACGRPRSYCIGVLDVGIGQQDVGRHEGEIVNGGRPGLVNTEKSCANRKWTRISANASRHDHRSRRVV
jgi:hypothetical protein